MKKLLKDAVATSLRPNAAAKGSEGKRGSGACSSSAGRPKKPRKIVTDEDDDAALSVFD